MVDIQRPSGVNVGVNNPGKIVYLKGNETTDGSFRVTLDAGNTVILFEERVASVWVAAPVELTTALTTGQVPKADTDGSLIYGGATVDPTTGEWTFNNAINVPAGSVNVGTTLQISEGGQDLIITDLLAELMSFSVNAAFADATGSDTPFFNLFGGPLTLELQPVFDTTLTDNPLTVTFPVSITPSENKRLTDQVTIKANGAMSNVRFKITDVDSGLVIRYLPNKAAYDGTDPGFDLIAGDTTFFLALTGTDTTTEFYLGYVPFVNSDGQNLEIEIIGDSIDLLGNSLGAPYIVAEVHEGPPTPVVTGPTTTIAGTIPLWDATDGSLLSAETYLTWAESVSDAILSIHNPGAATVASIRFTDESNVSGGEMEYSTIDDIFRISTTSISTGGLTLDTNVGPILFKTNTVTDGIIIDGVSLPDTSPILQLVQEGTNGGETNIFIGTRDPNGNVTGIGGDVYIRNDGTSSAFYFKQSAASDTADWIDLLDSLGGDVVGPASSTDLGIAAFDGTTGKLLQSPADLIIVDTANNSGILAASPSGTGQSQFYMANSSGQARLCLFYNEISDLATIQTQNGTELIIDAILGIESEYNTTYRILHTGTLDFAVGDPSSDDDYFQIDGDQTNFVSSTADTTYQISIRASGTNGGRTDIHVGDRNPESNVPGNGGNLYIREDDTSSEMYLKRSTASSTEWEKLLHTDDGIVIGPASATDNAIALFDGTTGELLQDSSTAITINASDETELDIISTLASGGARLALSSTTTSALLEILHAENTGNNFIIANSGDLDILNDAGNIKIQLNTAGEVLEIESASLDTSPLLDLAQLGTNGGTADIFVGIRNPEGNVTADGGSLYIRDAGTNSDLYLKTSDASNTDWVDLLHSASGAVIGPASSTNNSLAIFDGTTGELLESIAEFTVSESGLNRTLSVNADTLGTAMVSIGSRLQIYYDDAASTSNITGGNRALNITNDSGITISTTTNDDHITLETLGGNNAEINLISNSSIINMESGNDDTDEGFMLTQSGTNGGVLDIHVGDRNPEGNVSGTNGASYYRVDGTSSENYIKRGSGSTGWERFYHTGDNVGDVSGPGSSTDNALAFFNGTSGDTLQQTINIVGEDAGATAYIDIRSSSILSSADLTLAHFDGASTFSDALKIEYNQNGDTGSIQYLRTSNPFEINSAGELSVTAEDDLALNSTTGVVNIAGDFGALVTSAQPDTSAVFDLRSLGTNGGLVDIHVGDRDPEGNVTGTGGDLYARDNGVSSALYLKKVDSGTSGWHDFSVNGLNVYEIFSEDDFPNAPSGGEIDLPTGLYIIKGAFSTANKFVNSDADAVIEWTSEDKENHTMTSTLASDTLFDLVFSSSGRFKIIHASFILSGNSVTLVDCEGGNTKWTDYRFTFTGTGSTFGTFHDNAEQGGTNEVVDGTTVGFTNGLTLDNVGGCQVLNAIYVSDFTGSGAIITVLNSSNLALNLSDLVFVGSGSQSNFFIDPIITRQADVINNDTAAATTFFESGTTGSITLFADATITAQGIDNVTSDAGVADFEFTGSTIYVNQEVVISGYVTNTDYNGTFIITETDGTTYFKTGVAWGSDEGTGSFNSDSVTVTSATHGQSDDQTLLITETMEYNAGYKIYNALTNTYQINAAWDTAETTGTWDTGSLTETSKYVLAKDNGSQRDSKTLASVFVAGNVATTSITGVGTYDPLDLGTAAIGQSNEQFTLLDATTGEMRYDGLNPFDGHLVCSISSSKSGGAVSHNFRGFKTVGSPAFDAVIVSKSISTVIGAMTLIMSVGLEPQDQFRIEVEASSGTTDITISEFSLIAE